ncbi:MAG: hypothetical protein RL215_2549 [Planctomycetota bacterium]
MNIPGFGVEAVGDADEGFFSTAFIEFGDDHNEGILGLVEWWHVQGSSAARFGERGHGDRMEQSTGTNHSRIAPLSPVFCGHS